MSSCVMPNSPSPFTSPTAINTHPFGTNANANGGSSNDHPFSLEDPFDHHSFPFLDEQGMDYYLTSPEPSGAIIQEEHEDTTLNMDQEQQQHQSQAQNPSHTGEQKTQSQDVSMGPAEGNMSTLSIGDNAGPSQPPPFESHTNPLPHEMVHPPYSMYGYAAMAIQDPPLHHPPHFHPYRYDFRTRYHTTAEPISPPLSISPPGSAHSNLQTLPQTQSHSPPTAVSPSIVSPASAIGSMSDTSPPTGLWNYPLPPHAQGPGSVGSVGSVGSIGSMGSYPGTGVGTPLNSITALPNLTGSPADQPPRGMLGMMSGFPFQTPPTGIGMTHQRGSHASPSASRSLRPRQGRRTDSGGGGNVKKEKEKEKKSSRGGDDLDSDSDLDDDHDQSAVGTSGGQTSRRGTNVFSPADLRSPNLTEDLRKARIKSEQRRRDELREGFRRLREALPPSNQRPSKSSILDRSVAHIQQVESANHYLIAQLEQANQELATLRANNAELIRTIAAQARAGSGGSGSSSGSPDRPPP